MNAGSFRNDASVAPGCIISIFGANFSTGTAAISDPANPPHTLSGVSVSVGGRAAGLFFVSPGQINARLDSAVEAGPATVTVNTPSGSFSGTVTVAANSPGGAFSLAGTGSGEAAALNAVTFEGGPFRVDSGGRASYLAFFMTGLNLAATPRVTLGGVEARVQFAGSAPCCAGLQQVNVEVPASLSGAGRVDVAFQAGGKTSNVVEVVLADGNGPGQNHREFPSLAAVANSSLVLLADRNDNAVRVIDLHSRSVVRVISLPNGAEPVDIAVNAAGTVAVVAQRNRGKVALVNLSTLQVAGEVETGFAPTAVAVQGDTAVVVNQDSDSVAVVNLASARLEGSPIRVGRSPRGVTLDASGRAYVANQGDGTVTVIDVAARAVVRSFSLGENARPRSIKLVTGGNFAVLTETRVGPGGRLLLLNLATGATSSLEINTAGGGGFSDIAVTGTAVYLANQTGGSISVAPLLGVGGTLSLGAASTVRVGTGARGLAVSSSENVLLVTNAGAGNVVVVDLATLQISGRINAMRSN